MDADGLKALVRTVSDFPEPGILFRDVTSLLAHAEGLASTVRLLGRMARRFDAQAVAGVEARGFIFGTALAVELGLGFVPLRKPGKLPVPTIHQDYALEYGTARLELDPTLVGEGERVLLVDDLLATGGTAIAGASLLRRAGAVVEQALFVIDLPDLGGSRALAAAGIATHALMAFDGH